MSSVLQSSKMQFDRSGNGHLLCVEGEAIKLVLAKLKTSEYISKNLKILHHNEAENVKNSLDIEQFDSIKNLESRLTEILDRALMGTRFYAIGSEQFVGKLLKYARSFGLSEEEIGLEIVSKEIKNIYCSNCLTITPLVRDDIFICSNCGIKLEVVEHFSRLKNAYLGICADAEIAEPFEVK